jgi:phage terminase large subunit-like protein
MRHEKGTLQGQRFSLEDWQIFILTNIFGLVDEDGLRKYREAFILVPRGNGKSPLAAIVAIWMTFFDGEPGSECYCGAASRDQAHEVFRPAKAMLEQVPEISKRYGITIAAGSIFQKDTASRFKPVIRKPKDGASIYCAILDEWHEALDPIQYDCFKTGANKRKNSLLLEISTAGVTTDGPCYEKQKEVELILDGTVENDRLFGLIYGIDPETDWTSRDALIMANPNLGISNDEEALLLDQAEAVRNPAKQNIFKTKHLNVWCTALTAWMNSQAWAKCYDPELNEESVNGLPCIFGADMARTKDLSATVFVFRKDIDGRPHYYCLTKAYLPESEVNLPENQHLQGWAKQGWLTATSGASADWPFLRAEAVKYAKQFKASELVYDPMFADDYSLYVSEEIGIPRVTIAPTRKLLTPPMQELEAAVADGRFHHDGNPVLTWCMGNVMVTESNTTGLLSMPEKKRANNKIDAAVALFYGLSRAMLAPVTKKKYQRITFF